MAGTGTRAEVVQAKPTRVVLGVLELDLARVLEVALVADDNDGQRLAALLPELFDPAGHARERVEVCYVVHNQGAQRSAIVNLVQAMVLLLARRVPYR